MKGKQFYFVEIDSPHIEHFDEGWCFSEKSIRQTMEEEDIEELTVYLAQREKNPDSFYCHEDGEAYLMSDMQCGRGCAAYAPRNGKNGICKHRRGTWESTDEAVTFRRDDPRHKRMIRKQPPSVTLSGVEGRQTETEKKEAHG